MDHYCGKNSCVHRNCGNPHVSEIEKQGAGTPLRDEMNSSIKVS